MSAPVLVTGAAGKTGRAAIMALSRRGAGVRAFIRRPEQEGSVRAAGAAEVVVGDLLDPADVRRAMEGVRVVYHICPNVHPEEVAIGETAIEAAREAAAREVVGQQAEAFRFVYHSVLYPRVEEMPHHWRKAEVEERLAASGLPFTILQPCAYMQNLLGQWVGMAERSEIVVPYDVRAPMSVVDLSDVAAAAATVILEPGHEGGVYELCGPESITTEEMAEVLGRRLGRPVRARKIDPAAWEAGVREAVRGAAGGGAVGTAARKGTEATEEATGRTAGLSEYAVDALVRMFRWYDAHGFVGSPETLGRLLGRRPTSFHEFVRREVEERGRDRR